MACLETCTRMLVSVALCDGMYVNGEVGGCGSA